MLHIDSDRVDLRSDTITQPTPGMRNAMANAIVGDDVLGDDPTVIELQNRLASIFDKESALFVPSGTMSNAIAIKAQTNPGDEIITEDTVTSTSTREGAMRLSQAAPSLLSRVTTEL